MKKRNLAIVSSAILTILHTTSAVAAIDPATEIDFSAECSPGSSDCSASFCDTVFTAHNQGKTIVFPTGEYNINFTHEKWSNCKSQGPTKLNISLRGEGNAVINTDKFWPRYIESLYLTDLAIKGRNATDSSQTTALMAVGINPAGSTTIKASKVMLDEVTLSNARGDLLVVANVECSTSECVEIKNSSFVDAGLGGLTGENGLPLGSGLLLNYVKGANISGNDVESIAKAGIFVTHTHGMIMNDNTLHLEKSANGYQDQYYPAGGTCLYLVNEASDNTGISTISDVTITNNVCRGFHVNAMRISGTNIHADENYFNTHKDPSCLSTNIPAYGGVATSASRFGNVGYKVHALKDSSLKNSCMRYVASGIAIQPGLKDVDNGWSVDNLDIVGNKIYETDYGISVLDVYGGDADDILITGNIVGGYDGVGIEVHASDNHSITRVNISGNSVTNGNPTGSNTGYTGRYSNNSSIRLTNIDQAYLENNWIFNYMGVQNRGQLGLFSSDGALIKRNSFVIGGDKDAGGIYLDASSDNNNIEASNSFNGHTTCVTDLGNGNSSAVSCL